MVRVFLVAVIAICSSIHGVSAERARINLNGTWQFRPDPESVGVQQEWHSPGIAFREQLQVPGAWQAQGIGKPEGNLRNSYSGPAWYRRQIDIPASWQGKVIHLRIGGALRTTTLYVNGRKVGEHDGFSTPFNFDISAFAHPGSENILALRIDNPGGDLNPSPDKQVSSQPAGMMNYIGNWGGIYGNVELEATSTSWIDQIAITPEIAAERASFVIAIGGAPVSGAKIEVVAGGYRAVTEVPERSGKPTSILLQMPGVHLWTPDSPTLYTAHVRLIQDAAEIDQMEQSFGMREITTVGRVLLLNGKPLYLRGYGDDNVEVLTGVPPASKQASLERIKLARSFGFNAVRFHSMVPPSTFFEAADEAGLLIMAELPAAYTMHFLPHRDYLRNELERTLRLYRNHPSFLSLAFGNEFNLEWLKSPEEKKEFKSTVEYFYHLAKSIDPHRLILSNDGLLLRPSDMFSLYTGAPSDAPTVRHEFGSYYCSLPDVALIPKFTGVIRPTWLEDKRKWIASVGLESTYPEFVMNSKRLQQIGRKYQIERVRRESEVTGYHYWLATDYPGGTGEGDSWEEGWFDYFWQPKGIVPREGQEINSSVLLMIDADVDKRTMWNDETQRIGIRISNYGKQAIRDGSIKWTLTSPDRTVASCALGGVNSKLGEVRSAGVIELPPVGGTAAQKLELVAEITINSQTFRNRWNLWSFPHHSALVSSPLNVVSDVRWSALRRVYPFIRERVPQDETPSLLVTQTLDPAALELLRKGGRVWLMADAKTFSHPGDATFFPPSGGAAGSVLLDHPALRGFPNDRMFDLQFFNLLQGSWNLSLDEWPKDFRPIAGSIRTTSSFLSKSKKLSRTGYVLEARIGTGRLLVTTLRIRENFDDAYPEAMFLFDRLLRYATGTEFNPSSSLSDEQIESLLGK